MIKMNHKVSLLIFIILLLSLLLQTVLMHFRYHITRSDLINARFNVVANELKGSIDKSLKLGINLAQLANTQQLIEKSKKQEPMINSITVFMLDDKNMNEIFKTGAVKSPTDLQKKVMSNMEATKTDYWHFNYGEDSEYIGITLRDAIGIRIGGLYMDYSASIVNSEEKIEVGNLYLRLAIMILVALIVSLIVGNQIIKPLSTCFDAMNKNIQNLLANQNSEVDLSQISQAELRKDFLKMYSSIKQSMESLDYLQKWINEVQ
ncbi:MAG: hypothetical protein WCG04_01960 [Alphaproteobacteria bacterium]